MDRAVSGSRVHAAYRAIVPVCAFEVGLESSHVVQPSLIWKRLVLFAVAQCHDLNVFEGDLVRVYSPLMIAIGRADDQNIALL